MKNGIIDLCKQIEDPRMNRKKVHKMETIIYISIAAVICGAQSFPVRHFSDTCLMTLLIISSLS